jgi:hypothetical protein
MPNTQDVFNRIQENKREVRQYNRTKKEILAAQLDYEKLCDEEKTIQAKKKAIIVSVEAQISSQKAEAAAQAIAEDKKLLTDLSLKGLLNGEMVRVVDGNSEEYEPLFAVRFRKKQ